MAPKQKLPIKALPIKGEKNRRLVDVHFMLNAENEEHESLFEYMTTQANENCRSFTQQIHYMVKFAAAQMSADDQAPPRQRG